MVLVRHMHAPQSPLNGAGNTGRNRTLKKPFIPRFPLSRSLDTTQRRSIPFPLPVVTTTKPNAARRNTLHSRNKHTLNKPFFRGPTQIVVVRLI